MAGYYIRYCMYIANRSRWRRFAVLLIDRYYIERVHKQYRRLRLRVARVAVEKPWSDEFMKFDGDSKKRYLLKIASVDG